jgi:NitT/TauT family transport system permease protein
MWGRCGGFAFFRVDRCCHAALSALTRATDLLVTGDLYAHAAISIARVYAAFVCAVLSVARSEYCWAGAGPAQRAVSVVEMLRPIPPLAWVPLAVLTLSGTELPVVS